MRFSEQLAYVMELARSAGGIVRSRYGKVERLTKTHAATTLEAVTDADRESQRHIVAALRSRFPHDGLIGEESDTGDSITFDCHDPMGRNWVIDPIDGTNNFIAGHGAFAVCIGLLEAGRPTLGVVYDVTRDQLYAAATGEGAWLNSQPIHAAGDGLNDAALLMLTANLIQKNKSGPPGWAVNWIGQTNWKVRMLGSAALEAVAVASAVAYGAVTLNGKLWDVAAPAAIVLESGGVVTDLSGNPRFPFDLTAYNGAKVPFLAAAPNAHQRLLDDIRSNP